jgi:hypothetical protein
MFPCMADVSMDIEWGEQPFTYPDEGGPGWPSPLMRPLPWQPEWTEEMNGPKITIPDDLLDRWRKTQADLIEVQAELVRIAREQGMDCG